MNSQAVSAVTGYGAGPPSKRTFPQDHPLGARDTLPWGTAARTSREDWPAYSQRTRQSSTSPPQARTYLLVTSQVGSSYPPRRRTMSPSKAPYSRQAGEGSTRHADAATVVVVRTPLQRRCC